MNKLGPVLLFTSLLLFSSLAGTIDLVRANPFSQAIYQGTIDAPSLPLIEISPVYNNSVHNKNSLSILLNVSLTTTNDDAYREFISKVYYTSDWFSDEQSIYKYCNPDSNNIKPSITHLDYTLNLTEVPNGKHILNFYAVEGGYYYPSFFEYYMLSSNTSATITFTIDTEPPTISILSIASKTLNSPIPLNFTTSEPVSKIAYVLDNQENKTISGNTTLTNLPVGTHNITIYTWDNAGNIGASETIEFTIDSPKPNLFESLTITIFIVATVIIVTSLLLFRRHRKSNT